MTNDNQPTLFDTEEMVKNNDFNVELGGQVFTADQWKAIEAYAKGYALSAVQEDQSYGIVSDDMQEVVYRAECGLDFMLSLQRKIEESWGRLVDPSDEEAVSAYIRDVVLCATDELHEVLGEVNWKPWKNNRGIKDMANYREEMADVLHFILDLYLAAGLTGRDIVLDYMAKHYENLLRTQDTKYKES